MSYTVYSYCNIDLNVIWMPFKNPVQLPSLEWIEDPVAHTSPELFKYPVYHSVLQWSQTPVYHPSWALFFSHHRSKSSIHTMQKEKSPPKSPFWEKNKKPGSVSYLLTHGRISCQKLTKFGMMLANCNIYLCYFLHKVKILTPSCHKLPVYTVLWICFVFTDTRAHFFWEFYQSGWRTLPHYQKPYLHQPLQEPGHRLSDSSIPWS